MGTSHGGLLVEVVTNGPFLENCYLAAEAASRKAIVIDPGSEPERILGEVRRLGLDVQLLVCTHAHIDHAGAVAPLQRLLGAPLALTAAERPYLEHLPHQAAMFGLDEVEVPTVSRELAAGEAIEVGGLRASVLSTPGHTAGGCCLYFAAEGVVFVGDTLFAGSVGRTDLPGGSTRALLTSIREQLLTLEDEVVVYSGHGPETSIGAERRSNPYLQPGASLDSDSDSGADG